MIKRTSSRLLNAMLSIPPIRPQNLLPVVIMLILWIVLGRMNVPQDQVFVLSVVVAQAYAVWRNLPQAAESIHRCAVREHYRRQYGALRSCRG